MKKFLTCILVVSASVALGLSAIHCGGGSDGCTSNADCDAGYFCNLSTKTCQSEACNHTEACADKCGGDDGCGTGTNCEDNCIAPKTCSGAPDYACVDCVPDCTGRVCGMDANNCESCGICTAPKVCENGQCVDCVPDCTNRNCGLDPNCNQSCGTCDAGWSCDDGTCVEGGVEPGDLCPNGESDCPVEFPMCLSYGEETYCSKVCTGLTDTSCGEGNCCLEGGDNFYCFDPTLCPQVGEGDPGDPCPFTGDVNADADNCKAGLECLGMAAADTNGTCPGGADSECTDIGESWNPSCVGGVCGSSFCSEPCDAGACPDGFNCQTISDLGDMCVPNADSECTDPVNNIGCDAGYKCVVYSGALVCVEIGENEAGEVCGPDDGYCKASMACIAWGDAPYLCNHYCDTTDRSGCVRACSPCVQPMLESRNRALGLLLRTGLL